MNVTAMESTQIAPSGARAIPDTRFSRAFWLAGVLAERVVDGTYAPGERIREAALQKEFGFSNGPIREALQQLVADGLAQRSPWQGVRVIELGDTEVAHLFELRSALLEYASELAARRAGAATVASARALRKTLAKKFAASRAGRQPPVTGDLTDWIMAVAQNPYISAVWRTTMLQSRIYVYRSMKKTAGARTEPLINELIDTIAHKRPAAARKAARALTQQMVSELSMRRPAILGVSTV